MRPTIAAATLLLLLSCGTPHPVSLASYELDFGDFTFPVVHEGDSKTCTIRVTGIIRADRVDANATLLVMQSRLPDLKYQLKRDLLALQLTETVVVNPRMMDSCIAVPLTIATNRRTNRAFDEIRIMSLTFPWSVP